MNRHRTNPFGNALKRRIDANKSSGGIAAALAIVAALGLPTPATAQSCVQPPANLVSWWPGDGDAQDIQDSNNGILQNGATFFPGKVGQAFSLDGVDDFVLVPAASNLNVQSFTFDAWIFPTDLNISSTPIIEYSRPETGPPGVHLWLNVPLGGGEGNPGGLQANVVDVSGDLDSHQLASPPGVVTFNQWNHVALTYAKQTGVARIYVNGTIVAESNLGTAFIPQTSLPLLFGFRPGNGHFVGLMDEIDLYSRALTKGEIAAIANAGSAGKCKPVSFTTFIPRVALEFGPQARDDSFKLTTTFTLGTDSNGIAPLNEDMSLQVGTFSTTIPAGSFTQQGRGQFIFRGVINRVTLEVVIQSLGSGEIKFSAGAAGANLTGALVPLNVKLAIGDDGGSTNLAQGKAEFGKSFHPVH